MLLSDAASLAARASLGTLLASSLVLVPPLRRSFRGEVQPLLPNAAIVASFAAGKSLEETVLYSVQGFKGTLLAVLNIYVVRFLCGAADVEVYSMLSVALLLEASGAVAFVCLLPLAENTKTFAVGLTSYFMMSFFSDGHSTALQVCTEYLAVTLFGLACAVFSFLVPLWGVRDVHALRSSARAFEAVVDGCAELITEASSAFLGHGAGEVWRAMAHSRLTEVSAQLLQARSLVACQHWAPSVAAKRVLMRGRAAAAVWAVQNEAAFTAATHAVNTSWLLSELAVHTHAHSPAVEAVAVRQALAEGVAQVAEAAAELLRDFARTNFQQASLGKSWERGAEELLYNVDGDERRWKLRQATHEALRRSSVRASQELSLLSAYEAAGEGKLAHARADMAAFLFLVHSLAADLLHAEGNAWEASARAAAEAKVMRRDSEDLEDAEDCLEQGLWRPLLTREVSRLPAVRQEVLGLSQSLQGLTSLQPLGSMARARGALQQRGRIMLKVLASFVPAFAISLYMLDTDSTMVSTVAYVCSYGSQYSGGSLRRAVLRGVGIATGVTVGATTVAMQYGALKQSGLGPQDWAYALLNGLTSALLMAVWLFFALLIHYREGPYSYVGFVGAFTAIKFVLWQSAGGINATWTVMYNMYACLLTTTVEMGVLPTDAGDILRSRLSAALAGAAAALSALVTSEVVEAPRHAPTNEAQLSLRSSASLKAASEALRTARKSGEEHRLSVLPDLTELLKQAGTYDDYAKWRDGYMAWRKQGPKGSHGELTGPSATPTKAPARNFEGLAKAFAPGQDASTELLEPIAAVALPDASLVKAFSPAPDATEQLEPIAAVTLPLEGPVKASDATSRFCFLSLDPSFASDGCQPLPSPALQALPRLAELVEGATPKGVQQGVPLGEVQTLLEEITLALAPVGELAAQAAERLDARRVDVHGWRLLADAVQLVQLRLQLLARLALRLRHGVCVAELLGGHGEGAAAAALVRSFGMTLNAARAAVVGSGAPSPREAARLEARLQDSAAALARALARRPRLPPERSRAAVASEVLAGTAWATLTELLGDAAEVLARAVALGGGAEAGWVDDDARKQRPLDLPDLKERLREIGMYEEYVRWREGYMRWRQGEGAGAKGEITKDTTT